VRRVHDVLDRMATFATQVRDGRWRGHTGQRVRTVFNIGSGGSDLVDRSRSRGTAVGVTR